MISKVVEPGESAPLAAGYRNTIPPTVFFRAVEAFCSGVFSFLVSSKIVGASERSFATGPHATIRFRFW